MEKFIMLDTTQRGQVALNIQTLVNAYDCLIKNPKAALTCAAIDTAIKKGYQILNCVDSAKEVSKLCLIVWHNDVKLALTAASLLINPPQQQSA